MRKGDTLIEVMFAVGVFGLVAVGAIGIMNRGLYSAQNALEVTMARNEIDTQAEALRFIHSAYLSEDGSEEGGIYASLWNKIISRAYSSGNGENGVLQEFPGFYTDFDANNYSCAELLGSLPGKSFALNSRLLDSADLSEELASDSELSNVILTTKTTESDSGKLSLASTYPRLLYDGSLLLSDMTLNADDNTISTEESMYKSSEGVWVTAVASSDGVTCDGGGYRPDYYDFYIHTCWEKPGGSGSNTVASTVRLFNPDQINLTMNQYQNITFDNVAWTHVNNTVPVTGSYCGVDSAQHVILKDDSIEFHGYVRDRMNEYVYHDFDASDDFELSFVVNTANIQPHPGGKLVISLGELDLELNQDGGTIGDVTVGNNNSIKLVYDGQGKNYKVYVNEELRISQESSNPSADSIRVKFLFWHSGHCCSSISRVYLTDIKMIQHIHSITFSDDCRPRDEGSVVTTPDPEPEESGTNPEDDPNYEPADDEVAIPVDSNLYMLHVYPTSYLNAQYIRHANRDLSSGASIDIAFSTKSVSYFMNESLQISGVLDSIVSVRNAKSIFYVVFDCNRQSWWHTGNTCNFNGLMDDRDALSFELYAISEKVSSLSNWTSFAAQYQTQEVKPGWALRLDAKNATLESNNPTYWILGEANLTSGSSSFTFRKINVLTERDPTEFFK